MSLPPYVPTYSILCCSYLLPCACQIWPRWDYSNKKRGKRNGRHPDATFFFSVAFAFATVRGAQQEAAKARTVSYDGSRR
ncbi:hypothetical protein B0H10DRAFT_2071816 [Mycena sp. CBHHK59/15]|nr:hypothetical protein B0H10DRAFT_2071816 [Mycena sp. CBHHK59/15]